MNSQNNRRNHNFQIEHFLVGSCHTADGAYALLCDLREDRKDALSQVEVGALKTKAKIIRAEKMLQSEDAADRLEAEADLLEIRAHEETLNKNINAARAELSFLNECIERIQPYRKFSHLPDPEAHEAAQYDEWKYELEYRAVNFLLTAGTIPHDHFASMRQHPEFHNYILPAIDKVKMLMIEGNVGEVLSLSYASTEKAKEALSWKSVLALPVLN
jgi:hypothetical protein